MVTDVSIYLFIFIMHLDRGRKNCFLHGGKSMRNAVKVQVDIRGVLVLLKIRNQN